jgi:hypothetical protein
MRPLPAVAALITVMLWVSPAAAVPITYDFEEFADGEVVSELLGPLGFTVAVTNASAIRAGVSLNDFDFPPVSGSAVILDEGGPVSLAFSAGVTSLSGFFTYTAPVTLSAFLSGVQLGSVTSAFGENFVSSGNTPNELLQLSGIGLFDQVVITASSFGGSFTLDDLTINVPQQSDPVPEPGTLSLVGLGAAAALVRRRRTRLRSPLGLRR